MVGGGRGVENLGKGGCCGEGALLWKYPYVGEQVPQRENKKIFADVEVIRLERHCFLLYAYEDLHVDYSVMFFEVRSFGKIVPFFPRDLIWTFTNLADVIVLLL